MSERTMGVVLDFKRKRVVVVTAGNKEAERNLEEALRRQVKATATNVAPPPPEA